MALNIFIATFFILLSLYALMEGLARSRASGPAPKINWFVTIPVIAMVSFLIGSTILGFISLLT